MEARIDLCQKLSIRSDYVGAMWWIRFQCSRRRAVRRIFTQLQGPGSCQRRMNATAALRVKCERTASEKAPCSIFDHLTNARNGIVADVLS